MSLRTAINSWLRAAAPKATPKTLAQIIQPQARDRWLFSAVREYTPSTIESTIRGAFNGDLQYVWQLYDLMEATWPRLSKNLKELKDSVIAADWAVQPWTQKGQPPSDSASRRAQALEAAIWSMRGNPVSDQSDFRGMMADLLDAWGKGISVVEMLWETKSLLDTGTVIAPTAGIHVLPRYYGYSSDSHDLMLRASEIPNLRSTGINPWVAFTPDKFLIAVAKQRSGHPAGASLLRPLAWWWCASNFSGQWLLNFAQVFGLPIRWAQYDPNVPGLLDQVCDMLENMGSAAWAAFPTGTTIELKEPAKGSTGSLPQESVLDRADRQCDILILGQTLTTDVGESGSRALGDVHESVLSGRKKAAADWLAGVLTAQLAPAFCRLNWGDESDCPQFVVSAEAAEDSLKMAQRDQVLLDSGVQMPREWFYARHDIPMPAEGEPVVEKAAPSFLGLGAPNRPQDETLPPEGSPTPAEGLRSKCTSSPANCIGSLTASGSTGAHAPATEELVERVLEDLTGVQASWLGGVKPWFRDLVQAAQDGKVSDQEFAQVLAKAQRELPELFNKLDHNTVADALERAMGAAVVNGAVRGYLQRR